MHVGALIYLGLCLLVGLAGRRRKMGFYGYLFASIVLTPILGVLLVWVSGPIKR